jgi:hypothetical protein
LKLAEDTKTQAGETARLNGVFDAEEHQIKQAKKSLENVVVSHKQAVEDLDKIKIGEVGKTILKQDIKRLEQSWVARFFSFLFGNNT